TGISLLAVFKLYRNPAGTLYRHIQRAIGLLDHTRRKISTGGGVQYKCARWQAIPENRNRAESVGLRTITCSRSIRQIMGNRRLLSQRMQCAGHGGINQSVHFQEIIELRLNEK